MKKWKVRSALIALVVLLAGCSSNAQYNSSTSGNVGTAWGWGCALIGSGRIC
ncbi:lipoprotein [Escherichia coli]|nr:lipoprotein [Escherichia coli]